VPSASARGVGGSDHRAPKGATDPTTLEPLAATIEALQKVIADLVIERQALRARRSSPDELQANRLELSRRQHQLSYALIARRA
jgi:hypothetical protein